MSNYKSNEVLRCTGVAMLALDSTRSVAQLCEILQQKYIGDLKSADISLSGLKE